MNGTSYALNGHHPNGHFDGSPSSGDSTPHYPDQKEFDAGPSKMVNGYSEHPKTPYISHNEEIISHLYNSGFQTGNYADTLLHVHQNSYRLHAIILSRSPYLAHLMSTSSYTGNQRVIYVPLEHQPEVTQEGFAIALGYLYSAISMRLVNPNNARAVLAATCLLGGMDDLSQYAYEMCRNGLSVETISSWLEFFEGMSTPSSDGTMSPDMTAPLTHTIFGQYGVRLRDDVFHFLVVTLPGMLDLEGHSGSDGSQNGRSILLQVYARVPFYLFKAAIESPTFQIGSDQARFRFAKEAIDIRKQGIARTPGTEETVVLAIGGTATGGSNVHVTRKMRKRHLWKVNS